MEMTDAKVVEKKIYEDGKKEYASKGLAGTALGIGIGGLALALLNGNGRGVFGSLGGSNMPENVNINTYGANSSSNQPTALSRSSSLIPQAVTFSPFRCCSSALKQASLSDFKAVPSIL